MPGQEQASRPTQPPARAEGEAHVVTVPRVGPRVLAAADKLFRVYTDEYQLDPHDGIVSPWESAAHEASSFGQEFGRRGAASALKSGIGLLAEGNIAGLANIFPHLMSTSLGSRGLHQFELLLHGDPIERVRDYMANPAEHKDKIFHDLDSILGHVKGGHDFLPKKIKTLSQKEEEEAKHPSRTRKALKAATAVGLMTQWPAAGIMWLAYQGSAGKSHRHLFDAVRLVSLQAMVSEMMSPEGEQIYTPEQRSQMATVLAEYSTHKSGIARRRIHDRQSELHAANERNARKVKRLKLPEVADPEPGTLQHLVKVGTELEGALATAVNMHSEEVAQKKAAEKAAKSSKRGRRK